MELPRAAFKSKLKTRIKNPLYKNLLYLLKKNFPYISRNWTFLYYLKKVFLYFRGLELSGYKNKKFQEETFWAQKIKKTHNERISYISGKLILKPKNKKLPTFHEGTLKSQAEKNSCFLRVSKNKFIHFSSEFLQKIITSKKKNSFSRNSLDNSFYLFYKLNQSILLVRINSESLLLRFFFQPLDIFYYI